MYYIGILQFIVQIYFAVHAARTGRYWWVAMIFFFPVVGAVVYFFVEYYPEMNIRSNIVKKRDKTPRRKVARLQRELAITDSINNRINLAEAYCQNGEYDKAIELLEQCLSGPHASDAQILEALSYSHHYNREYAQAEEYLARLAAAARGPLTAKLRLLRALNYEALGATAAALREYSEIAAIYPGEEARYRYAVLLKKTGESAKAQVLFQEILKKAELFPTQYKLQAKWIKLAKAELK